MKSSATTVDEYLDQIEEKWNASVRKLRALARAAIPAGFEETMSYGMIGYVVPHARFPEGYHANPKDPLPFINIAAQKNHIAVYHMGLYGKAALREWFEAEYLRSTGKKADIGGACLRFKKAEDLPLDLLERLFRKMSVDEYIEHYKQARKAGTTDRGGGKR